MQRPRQYVQPKMQKHQYRQSLLQLRHHELATIHFHLASMRFHVHRVQATIHFQLEAQFLVRLNVQLGRHALE